MTTNEAAERLRDWLLDWDEEAAALLTQALAAERRATVERIAEQWDSWIVACAAGEMREMVVIQKMNHLLDEEVGR